MLGYIVEKIRKVKQHSSSKGGVVYEVTDIFTHYYSANDYLSE